MINIQNTQTYGWQAAIVGMRNPKNSWSRIDSEFEEVRTDGSIELGENDKDLMSRLSNAGPVHSKYKRMILVSCNIMAPLYWWKEFDTYKVGTVANSCSTMHKLHSRDLKIDDFSYEKLFPITRDNLMSTIETINVYREKYNNETNQTMKKEYWYQMIQLLPSSYNQLRTVMLNYEVLTNIFESRKDHKLDEWRTFCKWIKTLPYSELITNEKIKR